MNKPIRLRLLRHGNVYTGGGRFEDCFSGWLADAFERKGYSVKSDGLVAGRIFRGWQNLQLILWGFFKAEGTVNIVSARLGFSALLRGFFTGSRTVCVMHYFDRRDGKSRFLRLYYASFFFVLRHLAPRRFCIVAVSPFFQKMFRDMFPKIPVFLVPNHFDVDFYKSYIQERDRKKILLGQVSFKNDDEELEKLARMLSVAGYYCYFLTMRSDEVGKKEHYEIKQVPYEEYLLEMATSYCSVAFTKINEGWSRMSHESILAGTPVIGFANGGLGDLLAESDSYQVSNAEEAFHLITREKPLEVKATEEFREKYDLSRAGEYMIPILNFLTPERT